jgi:hypothetical protein
MPKAVLGMFGVVAGEELKMEIKTSRWGVHFAWVCGVLCGHWPLAIRHMRRSHQSSITTTTATTNHNH